MQVHTQAEAVPEGPPGDAAGDLARLETGPDHRDRVDLEGRLERPEQNAVLERLEHPSVAAPPGLALVVDPDAETVAIGLVADVECGVRPITGQEEVGQCAVVAADQHVAGLEQTVELQVLPDPRSTASPEALQRQFDFVWGVNRKLTETHGAITRLRQARSRVAAIMDRIDGQAAYAGLATRAQAIVEQLDGIEKALYQTRLEARQDPLNFPIRLNDKLAGVMLSAAIGDHPPTASAVAVRDELFAAIDEQLAALDEVLGEELEAFNRLAAELALPAVAAD